MVENMNVWDIARKRTYQKKSSINDNRGKDDYILLSNFFSQFYKPVESEGYLCQNYIWKIIP